MAVLQLLDTTKVATAKTPPFSAKLQSVVVVVVVNKLLQDD